MPAFFRHLALRCADMQRSRQFYEQVLGFKFVDFRPSGNALDLTDGTNNITILQHPPSERHQWPECDEFIHFGVFVDDYAQVWERIKAFGAKVVREDVKARNIVKSGERPLRSFKVLDPDGNVIDITNARDEWRGTTIPECAGK